MQGTRPGTIEEKAARLEQIRKASPAAVRKDFDERFLMSWIYHDSGLEGVVYTFQELDGALKGAEPPDSSLQPTYNEIVHNRQAIELVHELVEKKTVPVDLEMAKKIYFALAPEEAENPKNVKAGIFRKDIPVHRVYFHDITPPEKIAAQLKAFFDALKEERKTKTHPIRLAARVHQELLQISPFPKHSGKVARLLMNVILMRAGYPPALIHSTERQRYYEALKNGVHAVATMTQESLAAGIESAIRFFETTKHKSSGGTLRAP